MSAIYNRNEIIEDYLTHNFTQTELAHYYDTKYYPGYISSQTISKIINNKNLPQDIKDKIALKKQELKGKGNANQEYHELCKKIDRELGKIVLLPSFVNEENIMMLRVVYLYINNCTYTDISNLLGLSKATVSKYINELLKTGILNEITRTILRNKLDNQSKYNKNDVTEDIRLAVSTFIKLNGDYQETMKQLNISERTLSRYLSTPKLEEIVGEDEYRSFKQLVDRYNHQRIMVASAKSIRNKKIQSSLSRANTPRSMDISKLLKLILIDEIIDINELKNKSNIPSFLIKDYLQNLDEIRSLFGEYVYQELLGVYSSIIKDEDDLQLSLVATYLKGRYTYEEISSLFFINSNKARQLLTTDLEELENKTGKNISLAIQEHTKEVSRIKRSCPKDKYTISDPNMIELVRDDLLYVNKGQYTTLQYIIMFYKYHGVLIDMAIKEDIPYQLLYTDLSSIINSDILNAVAKEKLSLYMKYEETLYALPNVIQKWDLISKCINTLYNNGLDVAQTLKDLELPIEIFERIIFDASAPTLFVKEVILDARKQVQKYKQSLQKENNINLIESIKACIK